jgi:hypothetical protein
MPSAIGRVYTFLLAAKSTTPDSDKAAFLVWADVGGQNALIPAEQRETITYRRLAEFRKQVDLAEKEASKRPQLLDGMRNAIDRARTATSPQLLHQPWRNLLQQFLAAEVMVAWQIGAATTPDNEPAEGEDPLAAIREAIGDLEAAASDANITTEFRDLLLAQAAVLKHALAMYSLSGAQAIQEAVERVAGAVFVHKDVIARSSAANAEATETAYEKAASAFSKIAKWCRDVKAVHDVAVLGHHAAVLALPHLTTLLTSMGS